MGREFRDVGAVVVKVWAGSTDYDVMVHSDVGGGREPSGTGVGGEADHAVPGRIVRGGGERPEVGPWAFTNKVPSSGSFHTKSRHQMGGFSSFRDEEGKISGVGYTYDDPDENTRLQVLPALLLPLVPFRRTTLCRPAPSRRSAFHNQ